jgi:hypothetical protein
MEGPKSLEATILYNESKHNILALWWARPTNLKKQKPLDQSTIWTFIPWPQFSNACNSDCCLPIKGRHGAS